MQLISVLFFRLLVFLTGLLPFRLLYVLSDFTTFLLHRVIGYRKKVVKHNLGISFPEKEAKEINRLVKLSYRNLSDILLESLKGFSMHPEKDMKRFKLLNPQFLDQYKEQHKNLLMVTAHYNNWEWGSLFLPNQMSFDHVLVLYKPLKNRCLDRYLRKHREHFGLVIRSIYETAESFAELMDKQSVFTLVADQSPSNISRAYWVDFLGRPTAFLHGVEHYARLYDLPVIYIDIQRKKRGFYELTLSSLTDEPLKLKDGEITSLYARKMEEIIRQKPQDWLWSHKRWKHQPPSAS